jgi:adenosyl cobinamide kinase/adenosyl cobinamide phosphate guanylyltransferase
MAKVLGLKQLLQKQYKFLDNIPESIARCFGRLTANFVMIVWGHSANGKSNFLMEFLKALMPHGKVLYVALEEGFEASMQMNVLRHLDETEHAGKIEFADQEMNFEELMNKLSKKKSPRFVVIDSVQYWDIDLKKYKELKKRFSKTKSFIFISHAKGKLPDGNVADKIRYDATIKSRVEGFVVFVASRLGGNNPYVIWEEGAKRYWGKNYQKKISSLQDKHIKENKKKTKKTEHEKTSLPESEELVRPEVLVLGEPELHRQGESVLSRMDQ